MPAELALLLAAAVLYAVMDLVPQAQKRRRVGLRALMGNRHDMPELTGWAQRAQWAHANLGRSLPVFAIVVLAGQWVGAGPALAVGAHLYFWAYGVHQACYVAGIGPLRSLAWGVAQAGTATGLVAVLIA